MDRYAVRGCAAAQQPSQLTRVSDGLEPADGQLEERLELARRARTDDEPPSGCMGLDRFRDPATESGVAALEIEDELGLRSGRTQELRKRETRQPGRRDAPAVPEEWQRADALQVSNFDPAAEEAEVSFDAQDAETLRVAQRVEAVAGAVRDDEGAADRGDAVRLSQARPR